MATIDGGTLLLRTLEALGVEHLFQVLGDPLAPIAMANLRQGPTAYNFRHEQAAAMAAQAYGYMNRRLGVALVPSGPAVTNAITGLATAWSNAWPMLLLGGASETGKRGLGDFQEMPQVQSVAPFCKWAAAVDRTERLPWFLETAAREAFSGRPGPVYLDLPSEVLSTVIEAGVALHLPSFPAIPRPGADPAQVERAAQRIARAERPLLIIGKGAAWSDAGAAARHLAEYFELPFLPSPMGKGVIPDEHPLCVGAARSTALRNADLIIMAGARFNWAFHFGLPPRVAAGVDVIHIEIAPEEIGCNIPTEFGLAGDVRAIFEQLAQAGVRHAPSPARTAWLEGLREACRKNEEALAPLIRSDAPFTNFYRLFHELGEVVGKNTVFVNDGEHTMAISRTMQVMHTARERLDAGTSGCMGVGVPYAIGAQIARPRQRVVCMNGDYSVGWNAMELETAVRHELPILFIVANNGTIRPGAMAFDNHAFTADQGVRYDMLMQSVGGHGENVRTSAELRPALERALAAGRPALLNVAIDPHVKRKPQEFDWLDRQGKAIY
ncbi:MAG: thiamine pyrophosphate-binding protein [Pseudomonadales bacterium]|jgi:2-hydroxyacyl-CoA lyase 1|nr:thiamine pyrophosphate-binding protein [Gammaproteobacteria bacterium]MBK8306334.1 thiamine pyrophosphate-binding protein [Gammaproteobacteria bacterium]MBP6053147.1 thiamine pyrophosphate-binding protein [Pseudomonadales bacterium]MBP6228309.1 thiamine pyrophosphate-binding protein [Pseudomonadales bacterium]